MISKRFLKSSLIYTVAGTLPMASALILLPFYIHQLTTATYGALSIYLVFGLLIQILVTFSFDTSVYIHYHEFKNDKKKLSVFVSSAFVFMLIVGMVVAVVFSTVGDVVFRLTLSDKNVSFYPYGLASVGTGILQAIFKVHSSLLQSREKPVVFFWSNVLSFSLICFFTVVGLHLYPNTLAGPVLGRFLAALIPGVWALARIFGEFGMHADFGWLRTSFGFNAYTFLYQLQQWVINQFDRILMVFFLALSDVGVYDFAVKCLVPIELLLNGLHNSFYPKVVSTLMAQTEKVSVVEVNRYYHGLTAVVMVLVSGSILVYPWAIDVFITKADYQVAVEYIPYLALIYFFRAMRLYFAVPYGILKYSKPLPLIYFVISVVKIGGMVLLMPYLTIYGVIIASLLSASVEIILLKRGIRTMFSFRYNAFKIVIAPLTLLALIVVLEPGVGHLYPTPVHFLYIAACVSLLWWSYRNELPLINPFNRRR